MNYCSECGQELEPQWRVCVNCGNRLTQHISPPVSQIPKYSEDQTGKAIRNGILGVTFCFIPIIGLWCGIFAVLRGYSSKSKAGIILGIIAIILSILLAIAFIGAILGGWRGY